MPEVPRTSIGSRRSRRLRELAASKDPGWCPEIAKKLLRRLLRRPVGKSTRSRLPLKSLTASALQGWCDRDTARRHVSGARSSAASPTGSGSTGWSISNSCRRSRTRNEILTRRANAGSRGACIAVFCSPCVARSGGLVHAVSGAPLAAAGVFRSRRRGARAREKPRRRTRTERLRSRCRPARIALKLPRKGFAPAGGFRWMRRTT
jgi:hypothetical protein